MAEGPAALDAGREGGIQRQRPIAAQDLEGDRAARIGIKNGAQILEDRGGRSVGSQYAVAGLKAGDSGRAARLDDGSDRQEAGDAVRIGHTGVEGDGEQEIGAWPCEDDGDPGEGGSWPVRSVRLLAEHHIAADRQEAEAPGRAAAVGAFEQARPEADGELGRLQADRTGGDVVAEFVNDQQAGADGEQGGHGEAGMDAGHAESP